MKAIWSMCIATVLSGGRVMAQDDVTTNEVTASPVEWVTKLDIPIEPTQIGGESWKEARHGVILQFIEAPNPLAPLNPLTPVPPKFQDATLSRDHLTGRIMGLTLVQFEF